ncbi:MAG TPA: hypothetical protein VE998_09820 [Terriglobales bacterium]|nr:hypothetical protein [Terriglobales bacterium]
MAEQPKPTPPAPTKPAPPAPPDAGHIPITEEMDKAKWTLPPAPVIVIGIVAVAIVVAAFSYFGRSKPVAQGGITDVFSVSSGENSVIVALQFNLTNTTDKVIYLHHLEATANVGGKQMTDDHPLSAVDYPRYVKAFPALAPHTENPIMPETKIAPGQRISGSAVFGFDVTKDAFDSRQSLVLRVVPYDRPPFELAENRNAGAAK